MRTKTKLQFPSSFPTLPQSAATMSQDKLTAPISLGDSKLKLAGDDLNLIAQGAWGVRCLALGGTDIKSVLTLITSKLKWAINSENEALTKIHLAESLMIAAKNRTDISESFSIVPVAINDSELQVRNFIILALGYSSLNGADIGLFIDLVIPHLDDEAQINKEASVWTLKEHASKNKPNAHQVLMALGSEKGDNVFTSDIRAACLEALQKT